MQIESHIRSMVRSIIWRIMGILILALITWFYTRSFIQTTIITVSHHLCFIVIYYLHERLWQFIGDRIVGKKRSILRAFLYEIILGHFILGFISLIVNWLMVESISDNYYLH